MNEAFTALISPSHEFTLLSAASIGGSFSNVVSGGRINVPDIGSFLVTITETEVRLVDFSAVPEPDAAALPCGAITAGFAGFRRRRSPRA